MKENSRLARQLAYEDGPSGITMKRLFYGTWNLIYRFVAARQKMVKEKVRIRGKVEQNG